MRTLSYEDYVKLKYRLDLEDLRQDRYFRGLYGLVRTFRGGIAPEDVRAEYDENKASLYGESFLLIDVQIAFAPQSPLLRPAAGRSRKEALHLANGVLRRYHAGEPFPDIARDLNQKQDGTLFARRLRVRNTDNERLLFDQAKLLGDGDVSRPFETLAEVHIVRREKWIPAPAFEDVESVIRDGLAQRRAHAWLEERLTDPATVEIRWPPPDEDAPH